MTRVPLVPAMLGACTALRARRACRGENRSVGRQVPPVAVQVTQSPRKLRPGPKQVRFRSRRRLPYVAGNSAWSRPLNSGPRPCCAMRDRLPQVGVVVAQSVVIAANVANRLRAPTGFRAGFSARRALCAAKVAVQLWRSLLASRKSFLQFGAVFAIYAKVAENSACPGAVLPGHAGFRARPTRISLVCRGISPRSRGSRGQSC